MGRVFISYRQSGTSFLAHFLHSELQAEPLSLKSRDVFWDRRHIRGGEDFEAKVWAAADTAEVFVVLLDEHWLNDTDDNGVRRIDHEKDFCRRELEKALHRKQAGDRIEVIPVCCNGFKLPKKEELPASLQDVLALLHMELDTRDSIQLCRDLVQRIGECLELEARSTKSIAVSNQRDLLPTRQSSDTSLSLQGFAIESLQNEVASLAGAQGSELTATLLTSLRRRDVQSMVAAKAGLEEWLSNRGSRATRAIRCKVRTFLAEAEFSHVAAMHEDGAPFRTDTIRQLADQALQELADEVDADDRERLLCLMARLDFIDGHETKALASLGESTSPLPFKFRLIMLQELGRLEEANDLLQGVEPSRRWTDVAIPIRFMSGREDKATGLLEWTISNSDEIAAHHCRLAMARCLHDKPLRRFRGTGKISPAKLTAEELDQLGEVLKTLDAVIQPAIARGGPENGLEIEALEIAIPVAHLRSDREAARQFAKILALARPASTQAAQAFLWGYLPYSADLGANLRTDRPTSFEANFLAMTMEFDSGVPAATLVDKINALWSLAKDDEDRTQLAGFLVHFVPELPEELRQTVVEPLKQAIGSNHEIARLVQARQLLVLGRAKDAKTIADALESKNPEWDLLLADISESMKDDVAALHHLLRAAETVTHPDLYWRAAIAASRLGDWPQTIKLLQTVVKLAPDRLKARRQLFQACMRDGSQEAMRLALEQMEVFKKAEPDVLEHILNQAIVRMQLQDLPTALALLDELLRQSSAQKPEDSSLRLSTILHKVRIISATNPVEAFSILSADQVQAEFRHQVAYWQAYMQFGHRAGQDAAAHKAMEQIQKLEVELSDDQKSLWATDIEDVKAILEARGRFMRELRSMVTSGRCTISFVAMEENRPLVQEMIFRSQPMIVPDTEPHHGQFVTYATNGVILSPGNSGFYEAADPVCPAPKCGIVIDPTSILTLHRLGLLDTALARFEHVRVPGHMISRFIEVVEKLQPHQRSSRDAMLEVERILIAGGVKTTPLTSGHMIVEFDGEKGHSGIGIRHVINWLYENGQIGEDDFKQLLPLHFDDSGSSQQLAAAISLGPIHASTQALTTLARHRLLDTFVAKSTVCISENTRQEIVQSAKSYREFDDLRENYTRMIESLRVAPNVEFDGFRVQAPEGDSREEQLDRRLEEAALSVRLAKGQCEHLLTDDRVCQQMLANERKSSEQAIFSTWELIETLYDENRITMPQLTEAYLKLMSWRYRFFVPRVEVLLYWALQYRASCPGQPLRNVATYMMDCFADRGLPHGLEPTSPPFTISARLFHRWMTVVVDFIAGIWLSRGFSLDQKKQFVSWILQELVPIPAADASPNEQTGLAHIGRQLILSSVLVRLPAKPTNDSPSAVLIQLLRDHLGISKLEYFRTLGTTFQNLKVVLPESPEGQRNAVGAFLQRLAEHAVGADDGSGSHEFHIDHLEFGLLMSVGYLDEKKTIPSEFTSEQLAAISTSQHQLRKNDHAKGPLCFVWKSEEHKAVESVDVATGLPHSQRAVREAICDYLSDLKVDAGGLLSEFSFKLFQELEPTIRSEDASKWYPAAISLADTLQRDFLFSLAGFAQTLPLPPNHKKIRNIYANRVLNPSDHPAKYVSRETFDVLATAEEWKSRADGCILAEGVERSIQNYVTRFRHLPLDGEYSLAETNRRHFSIGNAVPHILELTASAHPLDQYQGCRVLCELWPDLTDDQKAKAVTSIGNLLSLMFDEPASLEGHLWQCRKLLVRHYLYQCELYEPGWPPDAITALAWKLADMVMDVITLHAGTYEDPTSYVQRVSDEVIRPMMQARELVARLIRRPSRQSLYRLASLDDTLGSPFGIGLLCEIEPAIQELLKSETTGPVLKRAMSKLIMANGPFLPASQSLLFQTVPDQWSRLVGAWLQNEHAPDRETLVECVAKCRDFTDVSKLTKILRMLLEADKETRAAMLYQIDRLAILDQLPHEPLWQVFSDATYQQSMLKSFDDNNLKYIINAIVNVQQAKSPEWSWQLPYVFLTMYSANLTLAQKDILVAGTVAACCRQGYFAALRRLTTTPDINQSRWLARLSSVLQSISRVLPSWSATKVRVTLHSLAQY